MKLQKLTRAAVIAAIMAQSPMSLAGDGYRSSIAGIDLSGTYVVDTSVASNTICDVRNHQNNGQDDYKAVDACRQGVEAANYMAIRYAAAEGRFLGCADGFQAGLYRGFLTTKNPSAEQLENARKRYQDAKLSTAISRAERKADSQGQSVADGEIIRRFRQAAVEGTAPNPEYQVPAHNFTGLNNGYEYDKQGGSFDSVYSDGWVTSSSTRELRVEARAIHRYHRTDYTPNNICKADLFLFDRKLANITLWDYFRARGTYDFKTYGWKNEDRVWRFFKNEVKDAPVRLYFNNIQPDMKTEVYTVEIAPAVYSDPVPEIKDPTTGAILQEAKPAQLIRAAVTEQRTRKVEVPGRGKAYFQKVYREAFKDAYDGYLRNQHFGKAFIPAHQNARKMGELAGAAIGRDVAKDTADMVAYNNKYREDSIAAYNLRWIDNYKTEWASIWSKFENNAMVEINSMIIGGDKADDIFKAGEKVRANLTLTNIGMKTDKVDIRLYGDLANGSRVQTVEAKGLTKFGVVTDYLASIASLDPRETARVGAQISGVLDYDSALVTKKSQSLLINEVAEIDRASMSINDIEGSGNITVSLSNPSKYETAGFVTVKANLSGHGNFASENLKIAGKGTKGANVQFTGLDPLKVIEAGKISGTITTEMGGKDLHTVRVSKSLRNPIASLARYFNALVTGKTNNAGDDSVDGRTQELISKIQDMTRRNIDRELDWRNSSSVASTIVGQLGNVFQSGQVASSLSPEAKQVYEQLGSVLNGMADEVGFTKRKAYRAALNKFAPGVEVKKKDK